MAGTVHGAVSSETTRQLLRVPRLLYLQPPLGLLSLVLTLSTFQLGSLPSRPFPLSA